MGQLIVAEAIARAELITARRDGRGRSHSAGTNRRGEEILISSEWADLLEQDYCSRTSMDDTASLSTIDQKMAEMRIKNLELLKRHQEIEEDRQLARRLDATIAMRGTTKNRGRPLPHSQENNPYERAQRPVMRRTFDNERADGPSHRLKRDRVQESNQPPQQNTISPELLEYAYPFHHQTDNQRDTDEPAYGKKLVVVNHQATRIGSGRFNQQRAQEQGQRRREERMRRSGGQNNGHPGGISEFHLEIPSMPIWQNSSMPPPPAHVQLLPTTINGHHIGTDHLLNGGNEQMDQSTYFPSFLYPSAVQPSSFNANGTVYFTQAPPLMPGTAPNNLPSPAHFPQFHPGRTFENSNRHSFHQSAHFQPPSTFQMPPPPPPPPEDTPMDLPPRFRRAKPQEYDNHFSQPRPMSGDFDRFRNGQYPSSSNYPLRSNNDHRAQARPQSFYEFSSPSNNNNNNNFPRSSNNARFQRNNNNNTSLPLSAYMNADDSSYPNDNGNCHQQWGTSYARRRPVNPPRIYPQDKHQFPLSSYDPRQYGFANPNGKRTEPSQRANAHEKGSSEIDLIEEWWEDNNNPALIGTEQVTETVDSQPTTTVNDSGNSSLSTSINLKESTLDDEENNLSTNDFISPPSDVSTSDSVIIESLDKLQQGLKLEEALDQHLAAADDQSSEKDLSALLNNETTTYDTAHFLQWARDQFREELAGRLTAQEIEQQDAVTTDEEDDDDLALPAATRETKKFTLDPLTDDENEQSIENLEELKINLQNKLIIDESVVNGNNSNM